MGNRMLIFLTAHIRPANLVNSQLGLERTIAINNIKDANCGRLVVKIFSFVAGKYYNIHRLMTELGQR